MLTVYHFPQATCALKVRMALEEKQLPYAERVLDKNAGDLKKSEYLKLNPNGVVPTLVHDEKVLIESSIIMNYIEDSFPERPLRPQTALPRAEMNHWLKLADEEYLPALGFVTTATVLRERTLAQGPIPVRGDRSDSNPWRTQRAREAIEHGLNGSSAAWFVGVLERMLDRAEQNLHKRQYLSGNDLSLADCAIAPFVFRLGLFNVLSRGGRDRPALRAWFEQIRSRASFSKLIDGLPDHYACATAEAFAPHRAAYLRLARQ